MGIFRIVRGSRAREREYEKMRMMRFPLQNQSLVAWCVRYCMGSVEMAEKAMTQACRMMKINAGDRSLKALNSEVRIIVSDEDRERLKHLNPLCQIIHAEIDCGDDDVWEILHEMWDNPGGYY